METILLTNFKSGYHVGPILNRSWLRNFSFNSLRETNLLFTSCTEKNIKEKRKRLLFLIFQYVSKLFKLKNWLKYDDKNTESFWRSIAADKFKQKREIPMTTSNSR